MQKEGREGSFLGFWVFGLADFMSVRHRSLEPATFRPRDWRSTTELTWQIKFGAATGIEPVTSCTRSRNDTSKPRRRCSFETAAPDAQETDDDARPDTGSYTKTQEPKFLGQGAGGGAGGHVHPEIKSDPEGHVGVEGRSEGI